MEIATPNFIETLAYICHHKWIKCYLFHAQSSIHRFCVCFLFLIFIQFSNLKWINTKLYPEEQIQCFKWKQMHTYKYREKCHKIVNFFLSLNRFVNLLTIWICIIHCAFCIHFWSWMKIVWMHFIVVLLSLTFSIWIGLFCHFLFILFTTILFSFYSFICSIYVSIGFCKLFRNSTFPWMDWLIVVVLCM